MRRPNSRPDGGGWVIGLASSALSFLKCGGLTGALLHSYADSPVLGLVFGGLLSFLLSPLVGRLERWLGRVGAVLVTVSAKSEAALDTARLAKLARSVTLPTNRCNR